MNKSARDTFDSGPRARSQRRNAPFLHCMALVICLAAATLTPLHADSRDIPSGADDSARADRRAAFIAELLDEGAGAEALAEVARLRADMPDAAEAALEPLDAAIALEQGSFDGFATAFLAARDPHVFRVAGCALASLFEDDPELAEAYPSLREQVALCEDSWSPVDRVEAARRLGAEAAPPASRGGIGGWLARCVVGFYRLFIGPAIGDRCVLEPSCSHYCLQATRKHGIVGVPMTADRFIREPNASAPERPWVRTPSGQWRHPDPVEDHDFWFTPNHDRGPSSP